MSTATRVATATASVTATTATTGPAHAIVVHVRGERFVLDRAMLESDAPNIFTLNSAPPTVFQRSAAVFAAIVDHLCGYPLPDPLPVPKERLLADARFYGFTRLATALVALDAIPPVGWEGKGFCGPVVELQDVLTGALPPGVALAPKRGIGSMAGTSKDRWLPILIRATNLPVYFSISLIDSQGATPGGFRYSTRFCLGLTAEQAAALRARYPDMRAAGRPFQFNEFQGHFASWFAAAEPHIANDGVAMDVNGVRGSCHMVRAWARSVSMRPYGPALEPIPLADAGARAFVAQLFPPSPSRSFALPADTEQWHYWRQARVVWASEVIFCLVESSLAPSLISVRGKTAMRLALGPSWAADEQPAMLPSTNMLECPLQGCSPANAEATPTGTAGSS